MNEEKQFEKKNTTKKAQPKKTVSSTKSTTSTVKKTTAPKKSTTAKSTKTNTSTKKTTTSSKTTSKKPVTKKQTTQKKGTSSKSSKGTTPTKKNATTVTKTKKVVETKTGQVPKTQKIKKENKENNTTQNINLFEKIKNSIQLQIPPILKEIDYKQIFFKLFLLLLVMMLLIFTISRLKKQYEKQNATINENLTTILDATLHYYQNNTLPINVGDSSSFLLEEMKNLNLISDIKDEKEKYCDYLDSYIILTKTKNEEYRLKIYLKCPSKTKTKEEKIICKEGICTIKK